MINFHPLEVVGRGSDSQLLVGENISKILVGKGWSNDDSKYLDWYINLWAKITIIDQEELYIFSLELNKH